MNATKARLVDVSAGLFQRRGFAATGIKEILAEAQAPFSSLYHHFPGGKDELAEAAIRSSGMQYQALVEEVWDGQDDVISSIAAVFDGASQTLEATNFVEACPIAVIALEVANTNDQLRTATAEVFEAWIKAASERLISALNRGGDRQANRALWHIVITRLASDPDTQAYMERWVKEGRSKREVIRMLKRYVAREVYRQLPRG